jgi:hypothetical protein
MGWSAPYPPYPEYGIELNFGMDQQGGGDVQPDVPVGSEKAIENKEEETVPQPKEEVKEEVKEVKADEPITTNDKESPVAVKEDKKEEKVKEKPKEQPTAKEDKKEAKVTDTKAAGEGKKGQTNQSQGDDAGKVGDKGNPQGKLDAKALYGKPGGGGGGDGMMLSMSGWAWADQPKIPDLPDNEDGKIEFEIECDDEGDIIGITTLQRGLSPKAEQILKDLIRKNSLIRTSAGKVPERSKGRVVFVLKTK